VSFNVKLSFKQTLLVLEEAVPGTGVPVQAAAAVQLKMILGRVVSEPELPVFVVPHKLPLLSEMVVCEQLNPRFVVQGTTALPVHIVAVSLSAAPLQISTTILS